jgi:hypothetical protein
MYSNKTQIRQTRKSYGQGILSLTILLSLTIIPLLVISSFEFARLYLAKQELQNASDAAALTGAAQLASSDNTDPTQAHLDAIAAAVAIFKNNTVLGKVMTSSTTVSSPALLTCNVGEAKLYFEFLNPYHPSCRTYLQPQWQSSARHRLHRL